MDKYGLIGFPLGHSFSKTYFNQKFESEHIDAQYVNFEIRDVKELKNILRENPDLRGLNVTLPHKTNIIPLLDEVDTTARAIGAVNVIRFSRGRFGKLKLTGFNSDVLAFTQSIRPLLNDTHRRALVLGTGGASKAVGYGLKSLGVEPLFVSRNPKKETIGYHDLTQATMQECTVIVNTTPVGMYPRTDLCPDIPYPWLTSGHLLYDLLYNPNETLFMKKGEAQGATVKNGLEMLLLQAFASWEIWQKQ